MIDEHLIDERATIRTNDSVSSGESVKIYIVDAVFTLGDEVSQAISRNPNPPVNPFGRPAVDPSSEADEQVEDTDILFLAGEILTSVNKILETNRKSESSKTFQISSNKVEKVAGHSNKHRLILEIETEITSTTKRSTAENNNNSSNNKTLNVIEKVMKALADRDDMKDTVEYLEKSAEDLIKHLPLVDSGIFILQ